MVNNFILFQALVSSRYNVRFKTVTLHRGPSGAQPAPHQTPPDYPKLDPKSLAGHFHSVFVQMVFVTAPAERRGQKIDRYADFLARNGRFRAPEQHEQQ